MSTRRLAKIERAIREAISTAILFEMRDPRVTGVTVLRIDVAPDLLAARVHVSVMGDEKAQNLCMHGLRSSRGFLQRKVADRIQTKNTPILSFELDNSVKRGAEASRILRELQQEMEENAHGPSEDESLAGAEEGIVAADLTDESENQPVEDDNFT